MSHHGGGGSNSGLRWAARGNGCYAVGTAYKAGWGSPPGTPLGGIALRRRTTLADRWLVHLSQYYSANKFPATTRARAASSLRGSTTP